MKEWMTTDPFGIFVFVMLGVISVYVSTWLTVCVSQYAKGTLKSRWDKEKRSDARILTALLVAAIIGIPAPLLTVYATVWHPASVEAEAAFYEDNDELFERALIAPVSETEECKVEGKIGTAKSMTFQVGEDYDREDLLQILQLEGIRELSPHGSKASYALVKVHSMRDNGGYGDVMENYLYDFEEIDQSALTTENMFALALGSKCSDNKEGN